MKIGTTILLMLLTLPLLVACGNEKAVTNKTNAAVKNSKKIVYANNVKNKITKQETPLVVVADSKAPVIQIKDTATVKPVKTLTVVGTEKVVAQTLYNSTLIASYICTPSKLKKFNVVVGSFSTLEKASVSVSEMEKLGYRPMIVLNEKGMYRVIVSSFDKRDKADLDVLGLELNTVKAWVWTK